MWFCPTLGRPKELKRLADSWLEFEGPRKPLTVRLFSGDPALPEYQAMQWPKSWIMYVSDTKGTVAAINEFWRQTPGHETYGFIGDDCTLTVPKGLELLESLATPCFISYPNDGLHRWRLPAHFCLGGDLTRWIGWMAMPGLKHFCIDNVWYMIGTAAHILRYEPRVRFEHHHYVNKKAPFDSTYAEVYEIDGKMKDNGDIDTYKWYVQSSLEGDVRRVLGQIIAHTEDEEAANGVVHSGGEESNSADGEVSDGLGAGIPAGNDNDAGGAERICGDDAASKSRSSLYDPTAGPRSGLA